MLGIASEVIPIFYRASELFLLVSIASASSTGLYSVSTQYCSTCIYLCKCTFLTPATQVLWPSEGPGGQPWILRAAAAQLPAPVRAAAWGLPGVRPASRAPPSIIASGTFFGLFGLLWLCRRVMVARGVHYFFLSVGFASPVVQLWQARLFRCRHPPSR